LTLVTKSRDYEMCMSLSNLAGVTSFTESSEYS
jgi:hypothetical protein